MPALSKSRWLAAALAAALLGLASGPGRTAAWTLAPSQRTAVERGEIVVADDRDPAAGGEDAALARAAVRIAAPPDRVFAVMTDCAAAPGWVPFMVSCRVLETTAGGAEQLIAHRVDYGWYAPRVDYVFRASYRDRREVRFANVSGDLLENDGLWNLELAADGVSTLVTYRVRVRPRFYLPQWLYRRGLKSEIPALLEALRKQAEAPQ
ncbi:MAG: SRPBCC family protein [Steroidobacteraceae bacterium]|jgi:uncharacterized protein YndB with AHSA1/START domain|nr:SRPBCC family protein [Steroidobacteraceae bacterium]